MSRNKEPNVEYRSPYIEYRKLLPRRHKDTKKTLSDFVPLWQKEKTNDEQRVAISNYYVWIGSLK